MNPLDLKIPEMHKRTYQVARTGLKQYLSERELEGPSDTINASLNWVVHQTGRALEIYFEAGAVSAETSFTDHVNVPLDWWEHFKARWFPTWYLARHPIKTRAIEKKLVTRRICPHLHCDILPGANNVHFAWLDSPAICDQFFKPPTSGVRKEDHHNYDPGPSGTGLHYR